MSKKILTFDIDKCVGCRICENFCSFRQEKEINPARSRIHVLSWTDGLDVPMVCLQCEEPACKAACDGVVRAISRDSKTGALVINYDLCIGCKLCMNACPFGAIVVDPVDGQVIKCDLCGGDPMCAKICSKGALSYVAATMTGDAKRRALAREFGEVTTKRGKGELAELPSAPE